MDSTYALNEETIYQLLNTGSPSFMSPRLNFPFNYRNEYQSYEPNTYSSSSYTSSGYQVPKFPSNYRNEYQEPNTYSSPSYSSTSYRMPNHPVVYDNYNSQPGYAIVYMLMPIIVPV